MIDLTGIERTEIFTKVVGCIEEAKAARTKLHRTICGVAFTAYPGASPKKLAEWVAQRMPERALQLHMTAATAWNPSKENKLARLRAEASEARRVARVACGKAASAVAKLACALDSSTRECLGMRDLATKLAELSGDKRKLNRYLHSFRNGIHLAARDDVDKAI